MKNDILELTKYVSTGWKNDKEYPELQKKMILNILQLLGIDVETYKNAREDPKKIKDVFTKFYDALRDWKILDTQGNCLTKESLATPCEKSVEIIEKQFIDQAKKSTLFENKEQYLIAFWGRDIINDFPYEVIEKLMKYPTNVIDVLRTRGFWEIVKQELSKSSDSKKITDNLFTIMNFFENRLGQSTCLGDKQQFPWLLLYNTLLLRNNEDEITGDLNIMSYLNWEENDQATKMMNLEDPKPFWMKALLKIKLKLLETTDIKDEDITKLENARWIVDDDSIYNVKYLYGLFWIELFWINKEVLAKLLLIKFRHGYFNKKLLNAMKKPFPISFWNVLTLPLFERIYKMWEFKARDLFNFYNEWNDKKRRFYITACSTVQGIDDIITLWEILYDWNWGNEDLADLPSSLFLEKAITDKKSEATALLKFGSIFSSVFSKKWSMTALNNVNHARWILYGSNLIVWNWNVKWFLIKEPDIEKIVLTNTDANEAYITLLKKFESLQENIFFKESEDYSFLNKFLKEYFIIQWYDAAKKTFNKNNNIATLWKKYDDIVTTLTKKIWNDYRLSHYLWRYIVSLLDNNDNKINLNLNLSMLWKILDNYKKIHSVVKCEKSELILKTIVREMISKPTMNDTLDYINSIMENPYQVLETTAPAVTWTTPKNDNYLNKGEKPGREFTL